MLYTFAIVLAQLTLGVVASFGIGLGPGPGPGAETAVRVAQSAAAQEREATDRAASAVRASEKRRAQLAKQERELRAVYEEQVAAIAKLEKRRASWRRDRQLRDMKREGQVTSQKLAAVARSIRAVDKRLRTQRAALVRAIEAELRAGAGGERAQTIARWRDYHARKLRPRGRKIILPDDSIDPLADPEDLEYQAALIRQSEKHLAEELESLERQEKRFDRMAVLQRKRQRADELGTYDDDQPRRATGRAGTGGRDGAEGVSGDDGAGPASPTDDADQSPDPEPPGGFNEGAGGFENDPTFVLEDVVDEPTLDALRRADRSSNPAVKARAARQAREQVREQLERLERRRKLIERRARQLEKRR